MLFFPHFAEILVNSDMRVGISSILRAILCQKRYGKMIYTLLIIFIILLVISSVLAVVTRKREYIDITADIDGEALIGNVKKLALSFRNVDKVGGGVNVKSIERSLKRSYIIAKRKNALNEKLYESEKWIVENYHYIMRMFKRTDFSSFQLLPHKGKSVRVVSLAEFIVSASPLELNYDKVKEIVDEYNKYTPLKYSEIQALSGAVFYAFMEKIREVAKKNIRYKKLMKLARYSITPNERLAHYDSYMYYYFKYHNIDRNNVVFNKIDRNVDDIELVFERHLIDDAKTVARAVTALKELPRIFSADNTLSLSYANGIMERNEIYMNMDNVSKGSYLESVSKIASLKSISERSVIEKAFELEHMTGKHFGFYLFDNVKTLKRHISGKEVGKIYDSGNTRVRLYVAAVSVISLIVITAVSVLIYDPLLSVLFAVFSIAAIFKSVEAIVNKLAAYVLKRKAIPRMNIKSVGEENRTLVTVSTYVANKNDADTVKKKLNGLSAVNNDENIIISALVDFAESDKEWSDSDEMLYQKLVKGLDEKVNVYLRKRVKNGGKYVAEERKRGAIMTLTEHLVSKDGSRFQKIRNVCDGVKYVILLDSDSEVTPDTFVNAIGTIVHPLNRRYDLMAFTAKYNLFSLSTPFAKKYYYLSGKEEYSTYSDLFYNMSGVGIYTGKGIYRVDEYYKKLHGKIQNGAVLSHDLLEGAILDTGTLGSAVYEDAPSGLSSENKRAMRWMQGDLQLIPFMGNCHKDALDRRIKSPKPLIYRYLMFSNVINAFKDISLFALLLMTCFSGKLFVAIGFLIAFALNPVYEILLKLSGFSANRRYRYIFIDIAGIIASAAQDFFVLPFRAINSLICIVRTFSGMITRRNMMKWKTFSSGQNSGSFYSYLKECALSFAVLLVIAVVGFTVMNIPILIYSLMSYAVIIANFAFGRKVEAIGNKNHREYFTEIAKRTYGYFSAVNVDAGLISDNYQIKPYIGNSRYTSPTNLAFSLLAEISGYKLSVNSIELTKSRIDSIIGKIENLEKYNGNLYNWYDVKSGDKVRPNFVSAVDNGNLYVALAVVVEFYKEHGFEADNVRLLIENMQFEFYYIKDRGVFAIGYDVDCGRLSGNYDILASEARLFNYVASIATGRIDVWNNLSRECTSLYGNTLLSWSGTAFEYMMPALFIDEPKMSLLGTSVRNAFKTQKHSSIDGIFGVSESGYYEFDDKLNYQYYAFGLSSLAERNEDDSSVVAPYASVMGVREDSESVYRNLKKLEGLGMLSDYGFFEALDMREGQKRVESYMSHHQGMSLVALINYLYDDYIKKLFMKYPLVDGGRILLTERQIESKFPKRLETKLSAASKQEFEYKEIISKKSNKTKVNLLTNGKIACLTDDIGNSFEYADGRYLGKFRFDTKYVYGGQFYIERDGQLTSPAYSAKKDGNITEFETEFTEEATLYRNLNSGVELKVELPYGMKAVKKTLTIRNDFDKKTLFNVKYIEEIMLNDIEADASHPVFNNMFVYTEEIKSINALIAKRKSMEKYGDYYSAMYVCGLDGVKFESNRYNAIGRYKRLEDVDASDFGKIRTSLGDVLSPCFAVRGSVTLEPKETKEVVIYLLMSERREEIIENIDLISDSGNSIGESLRSLNKVFNYISTGDDYRFAIRLASLLSYGSYNLNCAEAILNAKENGYIPKVGELNKIVSYVGKDVSDNIERLVKIREYLKLFNIRFDINYFSKDTASEEVNERLTRSAVIINGLNVKEDDNENFGLELSEDEKVSCKKPKLRFGTRYGGFDDNDAYTVIGETLEPYSNVVALKEGGFVATENGVSHSFGVNSRENKISAWKNDPVSDSPSEMLYYVEDLSAVRINEGYSKGYTVHELGYTKYVNHVKNTDIETIRTVIQDGSVQLYDISLINRGYDKTSDLYFEIESALGVFDDNNVVYQGEDNGVYTWINLRTLQKLYLKVFGSDDIRRESVRSRYSKYNRVVSLESAPLGEDVSLKIGIGLSRNEEKRVRIVFSEDRNKIDDVNIVNIEVERINTAKYFSLVNKFNIETSDKALDILFNKYLMYQVVSSRIFGRVGYYQAGGAIGFRDQLQDSLAMIYSDSSFVREHIIECAKHQYEEGDVMHWWHPPYLGVRTTMKDDRLFLPYVVDEYIRITGDKSIINETAEYIFSEKLSANEESRLENACGRGKYGSILDHMTKAVDVSIEFGSHKLSLIGSGDWNDALNKIGINGIGESVWLSMFLYDVLGRMEKYVSISKKDEYRAIKVELKNAIEATYKDSRYARAYTDNGEWLGTAESNVMKIDILSQAFAVITGMGNKLVNKKALDACNTLIDRENRLIKLLSPPFDKENYSGYISSYPCGIRENGGQYTHAAIWYIIAKHMIGEVDGAYELFDMINPISKSVDKSINDKYTVEPYVMPADVYSHDDYCGKGGWTWYTGSAAWSYKYILNYLLGIDVEGEYLVLTPKSGRKMTNYTVTYNSYNTKHIIRFISSAIKDLAIDGEKTEFTQRIKLFNDGKEHRIDFYY